MQPLSHPQQMSYVYPQLANSPVVIPLNYQTPIQQNNKASYSTAAAAGALVAGAITLLLYLPLALFGGKNLIREMESIAAKQAKSEAEKDLNKLALSTFRSNAKGAFITLGILGTFMNVGVGALEGLGIAKVYNILTDRKAKRTA